MLNSSTAKIELGTRCHRPIGRRQAGCKPLNQLQLPINFLTTLAGGVAQYKTVVVRELQENTWRESENLRLG